MNKIQTQKFVNAAQILYCTDPQVSVSIVASATGVTARSDGKKILKAGTPMTGDLAARNTAFTKSATTEGSSGAPSTSNAVGILLHDVDVTGGDENATLLIFGFVNIDRLDESVQPDETVKAALAGKITYLK